MNILGIIPARYASTRFPAKALALIGGKTMIQRVYEQAVQSKALKSVIVATDHPDIFSCVTGFGGEVVMTSEDHASGTDRCFEVVGKNMIDFPIDYVINIQGDEPFINPKQIDILASCLDGQTQLATLIKKIDDEEALFSPHTVKVVFNVNEEAIYFSREPIPHIRGVAEKERIKNFHFHKHIGIYAYRTDILEEITKLLPSSLEEAESLEQLRWLENGYKIKVKETDLETHGIDTPYDLEKLKKVYGF